MFEYNGYAGTIEPDDGVFSGRVIGLRDVVTFEGATFAEVEAAFRESIDDSLAFCAERAEAPDQPYSGKSPLSDRYSEPNPGRHTGIAQPSRLGDSQ